MTEQIKKQIKILQTAVNGANAVIIELKNAVFESCKEPEVLSPEEMFNKILKNEQASVFKIISYGFAMNRNGRLERDLELRSLFQTLEEMPDRNEPSVEEFNRLSFFLSGLSIALKNLKPLNKND